MCRTGTKSKQQKDRPVAPIWHAAHSLPSALEPAILRYVSASQICNMSQHLVLLINKIMVSFNQQI